MKLNRITRVLVLIVLAVVVAGCAAQKAYRTAERDSKRENWDRAVIGYSKAVALDPGNTRYSVALERAKLKASAEHFQKGRRYAGSEQLELAISEFQQTLLLNPGNQHALTELQRAQRELERRKNGPSEMEQRKIRARERSLAPPKLDPRSNIPILLNFRDAEVGKIFEALSKASGINFIFDEKTDLNQKMTVDIGNVTLEKALDILMLQTKNFYKVIDEHTLLIAPDTRQKRQEYEDQVIRTFYLSNGDTKQVVTLLRSLLQSRQIAENPDLNSVTIKDKPDTVAIAERIILANDKSKGEVLIDVELLEINRSVIQNLGIDLTSKTLSLTFRDGDQSVQLNNLDVLNQQGNWLLGVIPSVIINFLKSDSESRSIAKPQIRVTEGEKAEILIGDRVPIPTTAFNSSQTIGGNIVPITSFTYQNVGITVQIEPRVHHNKEVTLNVQVEVSQIASFVEAGAGQRQPIIGTRNIQTVIRLRDGETNMLAGLIKTEDTDSRSGIPGLMDMPGLNRVFSNNNTSRNQTDIILTLTPHIVRIPDITEDDLTTLWVGTEDNMRLRGTAKSALGASPFAPLEEGMEPAVAAGDTGEAGARRGGTITTTAPSQESVRQDTGPTDSAEARRRANRARAADRRQQARPIDRTAGVPEGADEPEEPDDSGQPDDEPTDAGEDDSSDSAGTRPSTPAVVRMMPSQASYRAGDVVELQVLIENASDVGSVPFRLRFNSDVLEFLSPGVEGPFMGSDGSGTIFLARGVSGGGEVIVGLSRMGSGPGANGSGLLATFRFQAINPGDTGFAFAGASVKDPQAADLPATFVNAPVQVEP